MRARARVCVFLTGIRARPAEGVHAASKLRNTSGGGFSNETTRPQATRFTEITFQRHAREQKVAAAAARAAAEEGTEAVMMELAQAELPAQISRISSLG